MSKEYRVERVMELPRVRKPQRRLTKYDRLLEDIVSRGRGVYKASMKDTKLSSMYSALSKRVKEKKNAKLHIRNKELYIEVL
mgnify:CR=1 FL=1